MKTYKVTYSGNSTRFRGFEREVVANSEREAVEKIFQQVNDENYFPEDDGTIKDCDGEIIATPEDVVIDYDGGCFRADLML